MAIWIGAGIVSRLKNVLRAFPREQVLFVVFEKFIQDQQLEFAKFQEWLGLSVTDLDVAEENIASSPWSEVLESILHQHRYMSFRKVIGTSIGRKWKIREILADLNQVSHVRRNTPKLSNELRTSPLNEFRSDIQDVKIITGLDLSIWLK